MCIETGISHTGRQCRFEECDSGNSVGMLIPKFSVKVVNIPLSDIANLKCNP